MSDTNKAPTVWVVNKGFHDYEKASLFGHLRYLTEGKVNIFQADRVVSELVEQLAEAKENDYILISGYAMINMIVGHYMLKRFGRMRVLVYEGNNSRYTCLTIHDFADIATTPSAKG